MLALFICAGCTTAYSQHYFDTSIPNKYVEENQFLKIDADFAEPRLLKKLNLCFPNRRGPGKTGCDQLLLGNLEEIFFKYASGY